MQNVIYVIFWQIFSVVLKSKESNQNKVDWKDGDDVVLEALHLYAHSKPIS